VKLSKVCKVLSLECENDITIEGLNALQDASSNEISFLEDKKYLSILESTTAAAVLVKAEFKEMVPNGTIPLVVDEPYISLARISKLFSPKVIETDGEECKVGDNSTIMKNVYLGLNGSIGKNCTIMAGAYIGDNVTIGDNTIIYPNVTVYRDCHVGSDCIIHAGTVVGSDGFGFATDKTTGTHIKIYQNGNVTIGNDVEIGANCSIDRAVFQSTIIEDMVRIDNLVHIAHNCKIGRGSILVTQVGISGSTVLHEYVVMGGQSATVGHIEIAPFTTISARGGVTKTITEPKKQWAGFPIMEHRKWLKLQGRIQKLLKG
jgi:UDP-3-O-[3-hydroxymyristoyl] glucosamine N-acyltransferase